MTNVAQSEEPQLRPISTAAQLIREIPVELLIAIVSHRVISAPTVNSLELLRIADKRGDVSFNYSLGLFVGDALISRGRSQAASKFLAESKVPYMLFVDDDIIFSPEDVMKIHKHLKSGKYDVIGGIYPVRGASQYSSYGWGGKFYTDGEIHNIEYLATGFMGITRKILEKVKDDLKLPILNPNDWARCYPFFEDGAWLGDDREKGGDPIFISEDWDFCEKVRKVGGQIFADTSIQLGHIRENVFTPEDVHRNQAQAQHQKEVYGAINRHCELIKSVDTDLHEFLKKPLEDIQGKLSHSAITVASDWGKKKGTDIEFYANNTNIVYDNANFNYPNEYFQDRIGALLYTRGQKVLDVGCGIGTLVFMLGDQECDVTGFDVNKQSIKFAQFKKKKYDLKGKFVTELPDDTFDLIVCVDVLEHIKELPAFLKKLVSRLKPGGKLFHSDYFPKKDSRGVLTYPMHYEENEAKLKGWFKEAGFASWDNLWEIKI